MNKQRVCFKYDVEEWESIDVFIPQRLEDGTVENDPKKWPDYELDREGVLGALVTFDGLAPNTPSFELLMTGGIPLKGQQKEICPVGLLDMHSSQLLLMEAMCEKYGCLPFNPGGTLESQPQWVIDAFSTISIAKDKYFTRKIELDKGKK